MRLVKFRFSGNTAGYINPDHVVAVFPSNPKKERGETIPQTRIYTTDSEDPYVAEEPLETVVHSLRTP